MNRKVTTEEFIATSIKVHGDKYEYDKAVYVKSEEPIKIYCKTCGKYFMQLARDHMRGRNCPCRSNRYSSTKDREKRFIASAIELHGDKYKYENINYTNNTTKVKLYCNKCKQYFYITPCRHVNKVKKCGCPCYVSSKLSQDEFISRSIAKHGDAYGYDEAQYLTGKAKVKIYCNVCKKYFWQRASAHMGGEGCRVCGQRRQATTKLLTQEEFRARSMKVHGDRYGYDKVNYKGYTVKVTLLCHTCGKYFKIRPGHHLNLERGCKCHKPSQVTTTFEGFVAKACKAHGDAYGYDEVDYKGTHKKVKIYCKQCEEYFWQVPWVHVTSDIGCRACATAAIARKTRRTNEQFIKEAEAQHGNKFGYDEANYVKADIPIKIYCKACDEFFMQAPTVHLNSKYGCSKCFYRATRFGKKYFVEESIKVHGDLYGYDKVRYKNINIKVKIFCNTCNRYFKQRPETHLKGCGCNRCDLNKRRAYTTESFIAEAQKVHGDKYRYDRTKYVQRNAHVEIYCNKCKTYFKQRPHLHLRYSGCPNKCYRASRGVFAKATKLYDIFVKGVFPYDTVGKRETTEIIMDMIEERVGGEFSFLSMPGNGREIKYMNDAFNLNIPESLGVELNATHFEVLRRLFCRLKLRLPMRSGNVDEMILDGLNRSFDVAHLDYNGFLTPKRAEAIDKLVKETPKHGLVFVTLNTNTRGLGLKYPAGKLPLDNGEIIMHQPYTGMRGAKMETFGIKAS